MYLRKQQKKVQELRSLHPHERHRRTFGLQISPVPAIEIFWKWHSKWKTFCCVFPYLWVLCLSNQWINLLEKKKKMNLADKWSRLTSSIMRCNNILYHPRAGLRTLCNFFSKNIQFTLTTRKISGVWIKEQSQIPSEYLQNWEK